MSELLYKRRPGFIPSPYIAELLEEEDIGSLADCAVQLQEAFEWALDQIDIEANPPPAHLLLMMKMAKERKR